jgi:hypothetical protein
VTPKKDGMYACWNSQLFLEESMYSKAVSSQTDVSTQNYAVESIQKDSVEQVSHK